MDPWILENVICPVDRTPLHVAGDGLVSASGRRYPVVDGIPILLLPEEEQTHRAATFSLRRARGEIVDDRAPELYLETLGALEEEKEGMARLSREGGAAIDPVVAFIVAQTSGSTYRHLVGRLQEYPIPELRLPEGGGRTLLDLGCNWGRWCVAAARKGYEVVGIDPSLGAVMAARRVAHQLGLSVRFLVADARFLPFRAETFGVVFSYSVLQHFSKENVRRVLDEIALVLQQGGTSLIQMPNFLGVRSLQHQILRGFRDPGGFGVRYWSVPELRRTFEERIGESTISVDCYFGLGLQGADIHLMTPGLRLLVRLSEALRSLSERVALLKYVADSVYVRSVRADHSETRLPGTR